MSRRGEVMGGWGGGGRALLQLHCCICTDSTGPSLLFFFSEMSKAQTYHQY